MFSTGYIQRQRLQRFLAEIWKLQRFWLKFENYSVLGPFLHSQRFYSFLCIYHFSQLFRLVSNRFRRFLPAIKTKYRYCFVILSVNRMLCHESVQCYSISPNVVISLKEIVRIGGVGTAYMNESRNCNYNSVIILLPCITDAKGWDGVIVSSLCLRYVSSV